MPNAKVIKYWKEWSVNSGKDHSAGNTTADDAYREWYTFGAKERSEEIDKTVTFAQFKKVFIKKKTARKAKKKAAKKKVAKKRKAKRKIKDIWDAIFR